MKKTHYDTTFIVPADLPKAQIDTTVKKIKTLLKEKEAEIIREKRTEPVPLAYPIQKYTSGIYHTIHFQAYPTLIAELEYAYSLEEEIIRFLTISLDRHAIAYYEKKYSTSTKEDTNPKNIKKEYNEPA